MDNSVVATLAALFDQALGLLRAREDAPMVVEVIAEIDTVLALRLKQDTAGLRVDLPCGFAVRTWPGAQYPTWTIGRQQFDNFERLTTSQVVSRLARLTDVRPANRARCLCGG